MTRPSFGSAGLAVEQGRIDTQRQGFEQTRNVELQRVGQQGDADEAEKAAFKQALELIDIGLDANARGDTAAVESITGQINALGKGKLQVDLTKGRPDKPGKTFEIIDPATGKAAFGELVNNKDGSRSFRIVTGGTPIPSAKGKGSGVAGAKATRSGQINDYADDQLLQDEFRDGTITADEVKLQATKDAQEAGISNPNEFGQLVLDRLNSTVKPGVVSTPFFGKPSVERGERRSLFKEEE